MSDVPTRPLAWADVVILDDQGNVVQTIPAPPIVDRDAVRPSVDDVGTLDRTRTVDQDAGTEVGTFTASTRPTAAEVESLIDDATDDVLSQLPSNIETTWYPAVGKVIALRVAVLIEASFYRDSIELASNAVAGAWGPRFLQDLQGLQARIPQPVYIA